MHPDPDRLSRSSIVWILVGSPNGKEDLGKEETPAAARFGSSGLLQVCPFLTDPSHFIGCILVPTSMTSQS